MDMDALGFAIVLLFAAHTNAQVRGPAQQIPLLISLPSTKAYTAHSSQRFPAQRLIYAPMLSGVNGYASVAPAPFVAGPNGYASVAPAPLVAGPNGYASVAPAPLMAGPNGYAAVAPAPLAPGPNGYAAVAPAPLAPGPNGYAAPVPTADPNVLCNAKWSVALRRQVMNPDNWQCGLRMDADGSWQNCVITGPTSASVFKNISACGWKMSVFCDNTVNDLMASLLKSTPANVTAPAGYTLIAGFGYYKVHTTPLPWDAAKVVCENEVVGGHLALLGKPAVYQAVLDLLLKAVPGQKLGAFIGYSDVAVEGTFVPVTGQPSCMLDKLIYYGGGPNNFGGNENCLALGYDGAANLNDYGCANPLPFICELPLPSVMFPC